MRSATLTTLLMLALPVAAQADDWEYSAQIYGWLPGLGGSVATAHGDLDFSSSGSDLISNLDMAFMGTFEARNGKWGFVGDLIYADLGNSVPSPFGALFASADVKVKMTALSGYALYRAVENTNVTMDVGAGFRAFGLDLSGTLAAGTLPTESFDESDSWVDPLIAVRANWKLSDQWSATGLLDAGGFGVGSDSTWQALVAVNYQINDRWSARFGYRYLDIDKPVNGRDVNLSLSGPVLGVAMQF